MWQNIWRCSLSCWYLGGGPLIARGRGVWPLPALRAPLPWTQGLIRGQAEHPAGWGLCCVQGLASWFTRTSGELSWSSPTALISGVDLKLAWGTVLVPGCTTSWRTTITLWQMRYVWHRWGALYLNKKAGSGKWPLCFQEVCGLPSLSIHQILPFLGTSSLHHCLS